LNKKSATFKNIISQYSSMSKQYNKQSKNKEIIEEEVDEETEIFMGRKQFETVMNRLKSAETTLEKISLDREIAQYKYQQSVNIIEELDKTNKLLNADLQTYKSKKKIKDTDLNIYDIDVETKKKNYEKRYNEMMKEAEKEIMELRNKYMSR
jgi:hypothetical protein